MIAILENEAWQIGIIPETGASTAFGRICVDGHWVDFLRPTPPDYGKASNCSSFLLVPWSNRVRDGLMVFRGEKYQLKINHEDNTAIHGIGRDYPWHIDLQEKTEMRLHFNSAEHSEITYPFKFSSRVQYQLQGKSLVTTLTVKNEDSRDMPAGFGHHPYFQRTLTDPTDGAEIEIPCSQQFNLIDCLPTGGPVPIEPRVDFRKMRELGSAHIDDFLTMRDGQKPIRIRYAKSGTEIHMTSDEVFQHVVIFIPQGKTFFACEPVTNVNDGFNMYAQGIAGNGIFILKPGEEKSGVFKIEIVS